MSLTVKAYLESGGSVVETRRFAVEQSATSSHGYLVQKLSQIFPSLRGKTFTTYWKDPEGDRVAFSSDEELMEALSYKDKVFRVFLEVDGSAAEARETPDGCGGNRQSAEAPLHAGIVCDGCGGAVAGERYKCVVCPDFDLCSSCERKNLHNQHEMLRIAVPRPRPFAARGPCAFRACGRGRAGPAWAPWCGLLSGGAPLGESERRDAADFLQHVGEQLSELLEPIGVSVSVQQQRSCGASNGASAANGAPSESGTTGGCCGTGGSLSTDAAAPAYAAAAAATAAATGASGPGCGGEAESHEARVRCAVEAMRTMGFHDDDGWLSALLRANGCDVQRAVNEVLKRNASLYP